MEVKNVFSMRDDAEEIDGAVFYIHRPDESLVEEREHYRAESERTARAGKLSAAGEVVKYASFALAIVLLAAIFIGSQEDNGGAFRLSLLADLWKTKPWLFLLDAALWILGISLLIYGNRLLYRAMVSGEETGKESGYDSAQQAILFSMGVPPDAPSIDVLSEIYSAKKGRKPEQPGMFPDAMRVYREGDILCFADPNGVVGIPVSDIAQIIRVREPFELLLWNKEFEPDKEPYRSFGITADRYGNYHCGEYYLLQIRSDRGDFEIRVPPYDVDPVLRLTGQFITEETKGDG